MIYIANIHTFFINTVAVRELSQREYHVNSPVVASLLLHAGYTGYVQVSTG